MADPRNTVTLADLGEYEAATFLIDGVTIVYSATAVNGCVGAGLAVTLSASKTVALAVDGDAVIGKLISVSSDNLAVVQTGDNVTLPGGASATLTPGTAIVGALGAASAKGYIRSAASGTAAELIKCRGTILDATTTTAVVVMF